MQVTSIREGNRTSTSKEEDEGNGAQGVGLRGVGQVNQWPQSLIKGGGSRASRDAIPSNQFSSFFNTLSYLEGNWIFYCGPQIQCHLTRMIF